MRSRLWKLLRRTALVLAALLVILGLVFYGLVRRAWPEVDGRLAVPGLSAPVEIVRVEPGVPHIYARNVHDLFFAQGYVHAQDRLWQMEFNRTVGAGRLSALFGEGALEIDKVMYVLGMRRAAEKDWRTLSPGTRAILTAYADGVNAYLSTHRGRLPIEFTVLGVEPRPWTPVDSLTWGKLMSLNLSLNHPFEILRSHLIAKLGEPAARRLMSPYPASAPVIVPPGVRTDKAPAVPAGPRVGLAALPSLGRISGTGPAWGSNGWVVAGSRTASGRPLLANDTHLGLQMPSVWYQVGLHGGGYDVAGFSFPGMPMVVIGHNRRIAWGITNLCADVQDLYIEKLDNPAHPRRYQYQNAWRELTVRREQIEVKGKPKVAYEVWETHHGPIVNGVITELKGSPPMALRWPALGGTRLVDALAALNRAQDWTSFHRALADWETPSVNFVYADVDGHIGYQSTARVPIRAPGHQGMVPVPGWDGRFEWQGFIPYEEMPSLLDPPLGFIVTANNKVVGDDYPHFIAYDMADPYRAQRITALLSAGRRFTRESLRAIQAETYGLPAAALRPYLLAVPPAGEREKKALEEVRRWDLRYEPGSAGASVFEAWYWHLLGDVLGDELGEDVLKEYRTVGLSQVPSIVGLMARANDPLFDDRRTPAAERRDDIVRRSLTHAVAWLSQRYGNDPADWTYGRVHSVTFVHSPLGQSGIAPLERLFNSATFPARGTAFTVDAAMADVNKPFAVVFGTSQRMIVDFADLEASTWVNSTGQNAQLWHRHREDQIPKWQEVESYPMHFGEAAVRAHAEARLTLAPK
ncbi:MAG TPA: penicillin acylase family protein [Thermoanaerobaculia bacterium]|jgi:penicillin amidase|nr:penicillin acylase family protein [Thermoanaerobaculia bacterium]